MNYSPTLLPLWLGLLASCSPAELDTVTLSNPIGSHNHQVSNEVKRGLPLVCKNLPTVISFGPLYTRIPARFGSAASLRTWAKEQHSKWDPKGFVPSFVADFKGGDYTYSLIGFDVFSGRNALILLCYLDDSKGCRLASADLKGVDFRSEPNRYRRGDEELHPGSEPFSVICEGENLILRFGGVDLAKTKWPLGPAK